MDSSFLSLLVFIAITLLYYLALKPKLKLEFLDDPTALTVYTNTTYMMLGIYFLANVLTQIGINTSVVMNKCGGSASQNFGVAFFLTLIPWIFFFGIVIIVLLIFPGFKSAFSNVIGYFAVAGSANNILTELLVNTELDTIINEKTEGDEQSNRNLKGAAEAIIKLCGNMSILVNQIVPENFQEYWAMITPLMKEQYQKSGAPELKQQLLDIVVTRDNIGEAMWYIYTAVLLVSITQYSITSRGCTKDLATQQASQQEYLAQQEVIKAENEKAQSTIYTS